MNIKDIQKEIQKALENDLLFREAFMYGKDANGRDRKEALADFIETTIKAVLSSVELKEKEEKEDYGFYDANEAFNQAVAEQQRLHKEVTGE